METLLQETRTFSFLTFDEVLEKIKEEQEGGDIAEINILKQTDELESGDTIDMYFVTISKQFI